MGALEYHASHLPRRNDHLDSPTEMSHVQHEGLGYCGPRLVISIHNLSILSHALAGSVQCGAIMDIHECVYSSQLCPCSQNIINQAPRLFRASIRSLIAPTSVPIIMYYPTPINFLLFNPRSSYSEGA